MNKGTGEDVYYCLTHKQTIKIRFPRSEDDEYR
jgi:hypothetical protein